MHPLADMTRPSQLFYVRVDVTDEEDAADHFAQIKASTQIRRRLEAAGYVGLDHQGSQLSFIPTGRYADFATMVNKAAVATKIIIAECAAYPDPGVGLFDPPFFGSTEPMPADACPRDHRRAGCYPENEVATAQALHKEVLEARKRGCGSGHGDDA